MLLILTLLAMACLPVRAQSADDPPPPPIAAAPVEKSRVFYVMDSNSLVRGVETNDAVVQRMVDALVMAAAGRPTLTEAWHAFVHPTDIVGIKVSTSQGSMGGTKVAVVRAIAEGLQKAGISPDRILVWDKNRDDMEAAGFLKETKDFTVRWIDPADGYDKQAMITAPVLGRLIWGDSRFGQREGNRLQDKLSMGDQLSSTSYFASILSKEVTKVINVPSLSDSFLTGIHGAIANMTLSNVDNWRRFTRAPNFGDPFLAEIYADPIVRDKTVLTILDGLALQFAGGPLPNPNFVRQSFAIFASQDPVAIDATALRLIEEYRVAYKLPRLTKVANHIESAALMGLGRSNEDEIETLRVGMEGVR
jgi:uncharacterized protein (DUF362 family)